MRYQLRLTRTVALVAFLIFVSYLLITSQKDHLHIPSFNSTELFFHHDQLSPEGESTPVSEEIQSFWGFWSQVFHDDRPQTGPIALGSNAQTVPIKSEDHGPRESPRNCVENSNSDIESLRSKHAAVLETLKSQDVRGEMFNGTGVVMMGGGEYFGPAIIGIHMLRKTGSTLPVEIFVADPSEYETTLCEDYLPKFEARCLVLSDFLRNQNASSGRKFEVTHYQLKSLAMLFSSFAEVLYLDSDSIPLVDPSELFSTEPYISSGLVVWPDFWIATESPLFYKIAGLSSFPSNLPKSSSEAGQLLINKKTHLKTLLLAIYYNIYGPDYYYPLLSQGVLGQGDKETFMAAALVLEQPYYRVKTGVSSVRRNDGQEIKGSGMVQHHPSDDFLHFGTQGIDSTTEEKSATVRPAFLHANTPKMNAGHLVDEGDLFSTHKKRLRLWGSKEEQEKRFGYDVEKAVWELLVGTGCELENVVQEWKGRRRVCGRLEEHWKEVF